VVWWCSIIRRSKWQEFRGIRGISRPGRREAGQPVLGEQPRSGEHRTARRRRENNRRVGPSEKHVDDRQILTDTAGAADVSPEDTAEYHASARARLLAVRRLKARDPDDQPELGSPPVCRREVGPRRLTAASSRWCTLLTTTRSSSTTWSRKGPVPRVKLVPGP